MTTQGDVGGSTGFLSPDHIRQFSDIKEQADIYSAGATLYFLITDKYPYLGFDPRRPDSYEMILEHPPVPLRAFRPDAPEGLEKILHKALQKQPRDRWKSARAMAEALRVYAAVDQALMANPRFGGPVPHSARDIDGKPILRFRIDPAMLIGSHAGPSDREPAACSPASQPVLQAAWKL